MEFRSYNRELAYANMLFKRPFSNIAIERDGKLIKFKCLFGNRSRIFKNMENPQKKAMYSLPMVIIQRTGITKNDERLANVWNEVKYATSSKRLNYDLFTPIPIDISYEVSFVSKYPGDIDMAISNFIPFFNKDLYFSSKHPKFDDISFQNQVIMENTITEEHPDELDPTADDIVVSTCSFTYKTFIFCGNNKPKTVIVPVVSTYISSDHYEGLSDILSSWDLDEFSSVSSILNPNKKISAYYQTMVTTDIDVPVSVVTSVEQEIHDGLIPEILCVNLGFYAVPTLSDHVTYMNYVDSLSAHGYDDRPFADRLIISLDENEKLDVHSIYPYGDWVYDEKQVDPTYIEPNYPGVPMTDLSVKLN